MLSPVRNKFKIISAKFTFKITKNIIFKPGKRPIPNYFIIFKKKC